MLMRMMDTLVRPPLCLEKPPLRRKTELVHTSSSCEITWTCRLVLSDNVPSHSK